MSVWNQDRTDTQRKKRQAKKAALVRHLGGLCRDCGGSERLCITDAGGPAPIARRLNRALPGLIADCLYAILLCHGCLAKRMSSETGLSADNS